MRFSSQVRVVIKIVLRTIRGTWLIRIQCWEGPLRLIELRRRHQTIPRLPDPDRYHHRITVDDWDTMIQPVRVAAVNTVAWGRHCRGAPNFFFSVAYVRSLNVLIVSIVGFTNNQLSNQIVVSSWTRSNTAYFRALWIVMPKIESWKKLVAQIQPIPNIFWFCFVTLDISFGLCTRISQRTKKSWKYMEPVPNKLRIKCSISFSSEFFSLAL